MDDVFFGKVLEGYEIKADNSYLLNSLYISFPGSEKLANQASWMDTRKNLLDRLENEVNVSRGPLGIGRAACGNRRYSRRYGYPGAGSSIKKNIARR
jgi:hypothetical protein